MTEQWTKWEPAPALIKKYWIDAVLDTADDFSILLSDANNANKIQVIFENSVDAYRNADETYRYKLICDLNEKYGGDFYGSWTLFKVLNSEYLKWISEQSCTISDNRSLQHFSFIAADSVLDVVAPYEPMIKFM